MPEIIVKVCWGLLAVVHLPPAAVLLRPSLTEQLYGVSALGETGVLLVHRGALFLAICAMAVFALIDPAARRVASLAVAISVVGFLGLYWRAGMPEGSLRTIAVMDAIALIPLAVVVYSAWLASTD